MPDNDSDDYEWPQDDPGFNRDIEELYNEIFGNIVTRPSGFAAIYNDRAIADKFLMRELIKGSIRWDGVLPFNKNTKLRLMKTATPEKSIVGNNVPSLVDMLFIHDLEYSPPGRCAEKYMSKAHVVRTDDGRIEWMSIGGIDDRRKNGKKVYDDMDLLFKMSDGNYIFRVGGYFGHAIEALRCHDLPAAHDMTNVLNRSMQFNAASVIETPKDEHGLIGVRNKGMGVITGPYVDVTPIGLLDGVSRILKVYLDNFSELEYKGDDAAREDIYEHSLSRYELLLDAGEYLGHYMCGSSCGCAVCCLETPMAMKFVSHELH